MSSFRISYSIAFGAAALALTPPIHAHPDHSEPGETVTGATEVSSAEAVEANAPAGPALWMVSDEDTTIYLFGTIHALPKGVDWYKQPIADALAASETLVTEIPGGPETEAASAALVTTSGMLPEETPLRSLLDEAQLAAYDNAMTRLGMPVGAFDRFEPWMASVSLAFIPLMQRGYAGEDGVEDQLEIHAGPDKARGALETIEFQLGIFDSLPQETQIDMLVSTAEQIDEIAPLLDRMVAEWMEGDADALAELMNAEFDDPVLLDALLHSRNANWAEWIDQRMDEPGTVFMAVGAGHLAGENSVQDLLAKRGIATTRVQ